MFKVFIQVSTFLSSLLSSLLSCLLPISQPASPLRQNRPVLSDILEALKLLFLLRSSCSPDTGCWIGRTQPGVFGHWVAPETESRWSYHWIFLTYLWKPEIKFLNIWHLFGCISGLSIKHVNCRKCCTRDAKLWHLSNLSINRKHISSEQVSRTIPSNFRSPCQFDFCSILLTWTFLQYFFLIWWEQSGPV